MIAVVVVVVVVVFFFFDVLFQSYLLANKYLLFGAV